MPVQVLIKGNNETNEYQDAVALKDIFEKDLKNISHDGKVLIICNATLFGQETKDVDLIVIGNFEKFAQKITTKARTSNKEELESKERLVFINDFCFVIETKRHRAEDVQLNGVNLLVKYNDKLSDVTTQSEKQKYSLHNFFRDRTNLSPYICNFIWLRNLSWESIKGLLDNNESIFDKHNYLPNIFSLKYLFQLACVQSIPFTPIDPSNGMTKNYASFSSIKRNENYNYEEIQKIFDLFEKVNKGTGELTRKKIEIITSKILDQQQYAQAIGKKLIVISGRAGTGKTIKILRISCDLAVQKGARCLILTYNHALVSDIKRILALAKMPDGMEDYTVNISTLHKFFYELLIGFGIVKNSNNPEIEVKFIPDFLEKYKSYLKELHEYIISGLIEKSDIQELMKNKHDQVGWDFILIDEAQDWDPLEKSIIITIFGKEKLIVADGIDQLVRTQQKCNWTEGLKPNIDFKKTFEKKGLRQKINLVSFVNEYANRLNINWELQPKEELIGGKVVVTTKDYNKELHKELFELCIKNGNSAYEMMFLVPPALVAKNKVKDKNGKDNIERSFKLLSDFDKQGIKVWDGTSTELRTQYAVDLEQHRVLQYESCRGLEGWTVVCLWFDEFINYKMETFIEEETNELALETLNEKKNRFVYLWSLIPLTRAIDTVVITLKNKDSFVSKLLFDLHKDNPDVIQWIN